MDYDPLRVSYEQLLDVFWASHDPTARPWSGQYKAVVFYHNEGQKRLALKSREREASKKSGRITTEVAPYNGFSLAEDYHQKYRLQQEDALSTEIESMFSSFRGVVDSTAAARLNGYLGGYGRPEELESEINQFGLSAEGRDRLVRILSSSRPAFRSCPLK